MNVRSFKAATMREAMNKVKETLGSEAVILNTREIRGGRNPLVEITAAMDSEPSGLPLSERLDRVDWKGPAPEVLQCMMTELTAMRRELTRLRAEKVVATQSTRQWDRLMGELKDLARVMGVNSGHDTAQDALVARLIVGGVEGTLARELVDRVTRGISDSSQRTLAVAEQLEDAFTPAPPIWKRKTQSIAAFVGPTGVGKTTTLAKVAAAASIEQGKKVAIVAADTYRIASVEQVQAYAELLEVPWTIAAGADGMKKALRRFEGHDLILVDTAGRNPWDDNTMEDLDTLLGGLPIERHLCVSAATSGRDLGHMVDRYQVGGVRSLVVTKADEARNVGGVLSTVWGTDLQIAHIATGQRVPGDLIQPHAQQIRQTVMG